MPRRVLLVSHPDCQAHDPGPGHPERLARLEAALEALAADAALGPEVLVRVEAARATEQALLRVHTPGHLARVRAHVEAAARTRMLDWLEPETPVSAGSWRAAVAAAGAAIEAAERVARGEAEAAFALVRPPGHHAWADRGGGYCLLNNVAIAARAVQAAGLARRVLVVDWDVHHCDGTQSIFWEDPAVYVLSVHLWPHYPHTGAPEERGAGAGEGTTRNVAVPHGTRAPEQRRLFEEGLAAALGEFQPDLVLLSAGFDPLEGDPEGGLHLEPADLHAMTRTLVARCAAAGCDRIAAVLEGGYVPPRLGQGVVQVVRALAGLPAAGELTLAGARRSG
ncbi:histone deacetylase superfamily [Anaeromyxobacter sp. K]|uniref:histone deacetylase family protein n=1 Tax=Anaeromyxobacter sp. (strain K) TaxID=447217 RepID=UPI00015F9E57|nr:histone deacetylase [Anaeromyxobacter sp. K]ACG74733.1 histone deacetylase superfamily [Anaeromyxobacter sp. K]